MRWILVLAFTLWAGLAQTQPVVPLTQASVPIAIAGAGTTQLVAGISGRTIYITSVSVIATTAGTFQLIYGNGATCTTGALPNGNLTGAYSFAANGGMVLGNGSGVVLTVPLSAGLPPQGQNVCVVTTAAMQGSLGYAQF